MVVIGEKFPSIEVKTTHGAIKLPDDFAGKWFVLFSHPGDFTPVCTTEFYAMQIRLKQFKELGAEVLGLSIDQVFAHLKWAEWIKDNLKVEIEFPIIADDRGLLAETLGMIPQGGSNTARAVFIVDPNGTIRAIVYYPAEVGRDWDEILRALKALQINTKHKVALPHKWPNNELIKDRVIIPPAGTTQQIEDRKARQKAGEIECYDWWLCHKKLEE
ncbi:peroxiredoxin [candidate division WOR-3 bacterium 4484_100]|uniref:Peroxiredoxin n=1 Tax=candidate division WOR-3 bacterium 4484_100 TaxID=1936077 RepID=A0A1V4QGE5_UNCW3|nr:MAG: peroxiredoxin [candidate division WOR-3 bacterium 4484_100]